MQLPFRDNGLYTGHRGRGILARVPHHSCERSVDPNGIQDRNAASVVGIASARSKQQQQQQQQQT